MGLRPCRESWSPRQVRAALRQLRFFALLAAIVFAIWLYRRPQQPDTELPPASERDKAPDETSRAADFQAVSLPPPPQDGLELASHVLASCLASEQDASDAHRSVQQQVDDKRSLLRTALRRRDEFARLIEASQSRAAALAELMAIEQGMLAPLQAADRQARSKVFDEETDLRQADISAAQFSASVASLTEQRNVLTAQRDAHQAKLASEVALLPTQLELLRGDLRRRGDAYLLSQSIDRAVQREERTAARQKYGPLCQLFSRQDEPQRESRYAGAAEKYVSAVINQRLEHFESEGLARQASLRGKLAGIHERLSLKQRELDRQQQYLDEAWKAYGDKQSQLQLARIAQSRTAEALRAAQEQVAARSAEVLAAQQEAAAFQPALTAADAKVEAASRDVDRWLTELNTAREALQTARDATREARTDLFNEKANAPSSGGFRTAVHWSF